MIPHFFKSVERWKNFELKKILPFVHLMTSFLIRLRNFKQVSRFQILHSEKRARARSYHIIIYIFEFLKNISVNLNKFILIPLNPCNSLYIYISILKITFISRRATSTFFHIRNLTPRFCHHPHLLLHVVLSTLASDRGKDRCTRCWHRALQRFLCFICVIRRRLSKKGGVDFVKGGWLGDSAPLASSCQTDVSLSC